MRTNLGEDDELVVDMAPLIDCVFLLLIFFLVATTLKKIDKELPLTLPDSAASMDVQQPDGFKVISIDNQGIFYLDGTPTPIGLLRDQIELIAQESTDTKIRIDADHEVPFNKVMQILDELRFHQLSNVGINTRASN